MRGRIIHYNNSDGKGLAAANDRQFPFDISQWRSESAPAVNQVVELQLSDELLSTIKRVPEETLLKEKASEVAGRLGGLGSAALENLRNHHQGNASTGPAAMLARLGKPLIGAHVLFVFSALVLPYLKVSHPFGGMQRSFPLTGLSKLAGQLGTDIGGGALPWLAMLAIAVPLLWRSRWSWLALLLPLVASLMPLWELLSAIRKATSHASAFDRQIGAAVADQLMRLLNTGAGLWLCMLSAVVLGIYAVKRTVLPPV